MVHAKPDKQMKKDSNFMPCYPTCKTIQIYEER